MSDNYLPKRYREYLGLGAEIAATLAIPIALGYIVDLYLESSPWGLLSGAVVGIAFFFFSIFRIAKKLDNNKE
ncbi:MAG: AtpZ/AtpI family protein [Balneolaceae bacterium]|nr:AtpZ/AtpI family protein [Balneolaceae bacterium]MBO6547407.1 AtpZ/AtpI family protein [Balneolaceae bacterium]MBO6647646.1 AtpZ/AtpI family protein [Balneolaceae bacterium]